MSRPSAAPSARAIGSWSRSRCFRARRSCSILSKDPGEKNNVADQFPEIAADLEARLIAYAKEMKPSEWIKAQPAFLGAQGKTVFDPDFDIDDVGLPHEKPALPAR